MRRLVRDRVGPYSAGGVRQNRYGAGAGPRDELQLVFDSTGRGIVFKVGLVICLPLLIIVMQNDTGSGIVLVSLLFVLYREG